MTWGALTALLVYLYLDSIESFARALYGVLAIAESGLLFFVAVTPLLTHHSAGERGLRLRMGFLIDDTVPYSWIAEMKETTVSWGGFRIGIGVRYARQSKTLFVTSAFDQLVLLRFDQDRTLGKTFPKTVREVVMSVDSARGFMSMLESRKGWKREV